MGGGHTGTVWGLSDVKLGVQPGHFCIIAKDWKSTVLGIAFCQLKSVSGLGFQLSDCSVYVMRCQQIIRLLLPASGLGGLYPYLEC